MNAQLQSQIKDIVDTWEGFDLSDVNGIIDLRRTLSTYYYNLAEYKGLQEKYFLSHETQRKNNFNIAKLKYIDEGKSATEATTRAETDVVKERQTEVKYEREYKYAKDILNSLDHILNAMSSAINQATNERKQSNYHT